MALTKGIANGSIVFGFIILILSLGCIAGGAFEITKLNVAVLSTGLWAGYFLIPSILLLVAGFGRYFTVLAVSIAANVLGIFVALAGLAYATAVWILLNATCNIGSGNDQCVCLHGLYSDNDIFTFDTSCSDLDVVRTVNSVVTILYVLLMIMSFVASIIGCAGACCSPEVPRERYNMRMSDYVIPYGSSNNMMKTRIEERRYFDHDQYPTPVAMQQRNVPRERYNMGMSGYVIPYGSPNNMMKTRIEQRRYFDHDQYPTPGRYGYKSGNIQDTPYYETEPHYGRSPSYETPNVPQQPDRREWNVFAGHRS